MAKGFMYMIEFLKEIPNKSVKEIFENRSKQWKWINKTVQDQILEIESIIKPNRVNYRTQTENLESSFINRMQELEERIYSLKKDWRNKYLCHKKY